MVAGSGFGRTADRIGADDTFPQVCPWLSGQSRCLRKGYGFLGYFGLSVFFFPLGLIAACMVHDGDRPAVG